MPMSPNQTYRLTEGPWTKTGRTSKNRSERMWIVPTDVRAGLGDDSITRPAQSSIVNIFYTLSYVRFGCVNRPAGHSIGSLALFYRFSIRAEQSSLIIARFIFFENLCNVRDAAATYRLPRP